MKSVGSAHTRYVIRDGLSQSSKAAMHPHTLRRQPLPINPGLGETVVASGPPDAEEHVDPAALPFDGCIDSVGISDATHTNIRKHALLTLSMRAGPYCQVPLGKLVPNPSAMAKLPVSSVWIDPMMESVSQSASHGLATAHAQAYLAPPAGSGGRARRRSCAGGRPPSFALCHLWNNQVSQCRIHRIDRGRMTIIVPAARFGWSWNCVTICQCAVGSGSSG